MRAAPHLETTPETFYFVCQCGQKFFSYRQKEKCSRCGVSGWGESQAMPWANGQQKSFVSWVAADQLNIANIGDAQQRYQRDRQENADSIARHFRIELFDPILVGKRKDDSLWVIDGQQRTLACIDNGIKRIPARVVDSRGPKHEAELFASMASGRKALTPADRFRNALVMRDAGACECDRICKMLGISIRGVDKPANEPALSAINGLLKAHRNFKSMAVTRSLRIILEAWPQQKDKFEAPAIYGLAKICAKTHAPDDWLVDRLKKTTVAGIMQGIASSLLRGEGRNDAFANVALQFCNAKRGAKYDWLDAKKNDAEVQEEME